MTSQLVNTLTNSLHRQRYSVLYSISFGAPWIVNPGQLLHAESAFNVLDIYDEVPKIESRWTAYTHKSQNATSVVGLSAELSFT